MSEFLVKSYYAVIAGDVLWHLSPTVGTDWLGLIPSFLSADNALGAVRQIDSAYVGGWHDFKGHIMGEGGQLTYPGDPSLTPRAECFLPATGLRGKEHVVIYDYAWCAVIQEDGSFRVARLD